MQILLACAKDMTTRPEPSPALLAKPRFLEEASRHALQLASFTEAELGKALKCNARLAILNKLRYLSFFDPEDSGAAVLSYNGMAYRHLRAWEFTEADYAYANSHLWICCFLYGMLRPMDQIKNYRLEGNVKLPDNDERNMFNFWQPLLTDVLIESVKQDDGCLVHLATEEMTRLFDWKRVKREVKVLKSHPNTELCTSLGFNPITNQNDDIQIINSYSILPDFFYTHMYKFCTYDITVQFPFFIHIINMPVLAFSAKKSEDHTLDLQHLKIDTTLND